MKISHLSSPFESTSGDWRMLSPRNAKRRDGLIQPWESDSQHGVVRWHFCIWELNAMGHVAVDIEIPKGAHRVIDEKEVFGGHIFPGLTWLLERDATQTTARL